MVLNLMEGSISLRMMHVKEDAEEEKDRETVKVKKTMSPKKETSCFSLERERRRGRSPGYSFTGSSIERCL